MDKITIQAWKVPAYDILGKIIDHTFVYCPEHESHYYCFDYKKLNIDSPGAELITSGSCVADVYCLANKIRLPIVDKKSHILLPDTGGILIYGYNGVCHQATNRFLYPAGLKLTSNSKKSKKKIKGYVASYANYGLRGTAIPASSTAGIQLGTKLYHKIWKDKFYKPALKKCGVSSHEDLQERNDTVRVAPKIESINLSTTKKVDAINPVTNSGANEKDLERFVLATFQEIDPGKIDHIHSELLLENAKIFNSAAHIDLEKNQIRLPQGRDGERLVSKLNDMNIEFQKELSSQIGAERFQELTGSQDFVPIIDPEIAAICWKEYS